VGEENRLSTRLGDSRESPCSVLLALTVASCASNPPSSENRSQITESVARKAVKEPAPDCEAGHKDALYNGTIFIRPGEVICVRLKMLGSVVVPAEIVEKGGPADTLIIRMWQEKGDQATYLYIHNPLGRLLVYDASMLRLGASTFQHTSTCPVLSHRIAFEQWPYPIATLVLANFVTKPDDGQIVCE